MIKKLLVLSLVLGTIAFYAAPGYGSPQSAGNDQHAAGFSDSLSAVLKKLRFKDGNGRIVSLPALKGKVVVLNYWAPWCPPCVKEMPSFNRLKMQFGDNDCLVFLMVAVDNEYAKAKAFMDKHGYDLPVYTPDGQILNELFSGAIPTTAIFNRENKLVDIYIETEDLSVPDFAAKIKKLLD